MDDRFRIDEVDIDDEVPLRGKATLVEIASHDGHEYISVVYDPPRDGCAFDTLDVRQVDGGGDGAALLLGARLILRLEGYELIVPDDYYLSM